MDEALLAILGHRSAHSLATGPVIAEPFISPLLFTITPALSSKKMKMPSFRRHALEWRYGEVRNRMMNEWRGTLSQ